MKGVIKTTSTALTNASFLTLLGDMVEAVVGWAGTILEFILGQPVLLVPIFVFFVAGGAIGIINRIIRG